MSAIILDLCAGSGSWSRPYEEAGYTVQRIDLPTDVRLLKLPSVPGGVHGVLAAPPCTCFARSGASTPRSREEMLEALGIVDACIRLAVQLRPAWWALENPVGKLVDYLGRPRFEFDPCDFGDPYTKRTYLWGRFTLPAKRPVPVTMPDYIHRLDAGSREATRAARSVTPSGFARAFFEANP